MTVEDLMIHFQYGPDNQQQDYGDSSRFHRQFYMPGEEMRGIVTVHLRRPLRVYGITIHFMGTATVSWEATEKSKVYQSSEVYLEAAKNLLDIGYDRSIELPTGLHQFGFNFLLPTNLPSTFEGTYGQVTYLAKVKLAAEDEANTTVTSEPFMVLRRNRLPLDAYDEKTLKKNKHFWGFNSGRIKISCTIDKPAAVPGDHITVSGEVINHTNKKITHIQAAMIRDAVYYAQGRELTFRQYLSKRNDVFDIHVRHGRQWHDVLLPVPPFLADSGLENCNIMDVSYTFQFKVGIEGRQDIVLDTPLYIGAHHPDMGVDEQYFLLGRMYKNLGVGEVGHQIPDTDRTWVPERPTRSLYSDDFYREYSSVPENRAPLRAIAYQL